MKGWIKLYRSIQEHWLWQSEPFSYQSAWIDLLLMANHEPRKVKAGNKFVTIKTGQRWTSIRKLSDKWHWKTDKVSSFLKLLEDDEMITKEPTRSGTLLTIVNYEKYQGLDGIEDNKKPTPQGTQEGTQLGTPRGTPKGTPRGTPQGTHKQEYKNDKNEKNEKEAAVAAIALSQQQPPQPQLGASFLREVVQAWNRQECTRDIRKIFGTRFDQVAACAADDPQRFLSVIESLDAQQYLRRTGRPVTFDWFCSPENFEKVADGNYAELYGGGGTGGKLRRDW